MKKVLAIVLALVMVCTLAMAKVDYKSVKMGDEKVTTLTGKYSVLDITTNKVEVKDATDVKLYTHADDVYTTKNDNTLTVAYPDEYQYKDFTGYAVDSSVAQYKLVKDGKVVAYLAEGKTEGTISVTATTVKYAKGTVIGCGDYMVADKGDKVTEDVTVYVADVYAGFMAKTVKDEMVKVAFTADKNGELVKVNGKFIKVSEVEGIYDHGYLAIDTYVKNVPGSDIATAYCEDCDKVINVLKKVPVASTAAYTEIAEWMVADDNEALVGYFFLTADLDVTAPAATTTTNPDTGANDVIGVAAALAVVALVSGAAISLKK